MSVNYAAGLSNFPHIHKGKCGLPEIHDSPDVLKKGIEQLVDLIRNSKHMVVHTGAGISTTAGIPDFRGPNGVWTLEAKGEAPVVNINFDEAIPTKTHMAILGLQQSGIVKYVVSQNIDGLHLRSGYPRSQLSELHGNMFVEKCEKCGHEYYRRTPVSTMTQKRTGNLCLQRGKRGLTNCRGKLRDTILDWEDSLPTEDLYNAEIESKKADLALCLGTTLQIVPSGKLPLFTLKNDGKMVIVNLQKTKYDKKANLLLHTYVDDIMEGLMEGLGLTIPKFQPEFYLSMVQMLPDDQPQKIKFDNEKVDEEMKCPQNWKIVEDTKNYSVEETDPRNTIPTLNWSYIRSVSNNAAKGERVSEILTNGGCHDDEQTKQVEIKQEEIKQEENTVYVENSVCKNEKKQQEGKLEENNITGGANCENVEAKHSDSYRWDNFRVVRQLKHPVIDTDAVECKKTKM